MAQGRASIGSWLQSEARRRFFESIVLALDTYDFDVSQNVFNNYAASMS
jgi:hypothetical protein